MVAAGDGNQKQLKPMLHTGTNKEDIKIQDDSQTNQKKGGRPNSKGEGAKQRGGKDGEDTKVINYETFESSSEDEYSCGAFESAAASFQNKEK